MVGDCPKILGSARYQVLQVANFLAPQFDELIILGVKSLVSSIAIVVLRGISRLLAL